MVVSYCCCSPGARAPGWLVLVLCCLASSTAAAAASGRGLLQEGIDRLQLSPEAQLQQPPPALAAPQVEETAEGQDEVCTQNFRDAFNAAVSHVIGSRQLTRHLLPLWGQGEAYVPLLVCAPSIPAGDDAFPSSSQWPPKEVLQPDDLLFQILARQTVRVASLAHVRGSSLSLLFKGAGGDYTAEPPTGFFPDYLRALLRTIGQKYGVSLKAEYLFFPDVETAQAAVAVGLADLTDIYFLHAHNNKQLSAERLGALAINTSNPLSFLYMACPVVGAAVFVYTAHEKASSLEDIVYALSRADAELKTEKDKSHEPTFKTTVIAASQELKQTIAPVLPSSTTIEVEENAGKALKAVAAGDALAAFFLGATAPDSLPQGVFLNKGADIILAKGAWIRRSVTTKCLRREHGNDLKGQLSSNQPPS
ncbi:hypothetical protein Esti_005372 [Eimeria stiedai]